LLETEKLKDQLFDQFDSETLEATPILKAQFKEATNCSLKPEEFKENPLVDYEKLFWKLFQRNE